MRPNEAERSTGALDGAFGGGDCDLLREDCTPYPSALSFCMRKARRASTSLSSSSHAAHTCASAGGAGGAGGGSGGGL